MIAILALALAGCTVTDGDTIRCGDERIRLLAIDAPELPQHCGRRRACGEGDPFASASNLRVAMEGRALTILRTGTDRFGRTVGVVYADGANLSCRQIGDGHAVYQRKYDREAGFPVSRDCADLAVAVEAPAP